MGEYPKAPLNGADLDQFVNSLGFTRFLSAEPLDGYHWSAQWEAWEEGDHMFRKRLLAALDGSAKIGYDT